MLKNLKLLDLSANCILEVPNVKELPSSLISLDLRLNPCVENTSKWQDISQNLFKNFLKKLNGDSLKKFSGGEHDDDEMEIESHDVGLSSEEENESETFETMRKKVIERSKLRQKNDISYLETISQERKLRLDEARRSVTANFKS